MQDVPVAVVLAQVIGRHDRIPVRAPNGKLPPAQDQFTVSPSSGELQYRNLPNGLQFRASDPTSGIRQTASSAGHTSPRLDPPAIGDAARGWLQFLLS
jgi:hypothetical protein